MKNLKIIKTLIATYAKILTTEVEDLETIRNHGLDSDDFFELIISLQEIYEINLLKDVNIDMTVKSLRSIIKSKLE